MHDDTARYVQATVSAGDLLEGYRTRSLSPLEVSEAALARIDALDGELGAMVAVLADLARRQAEQAERAWKAGGETGPLEGVPVTIKDTFDVAGSVSTCGSRLFARRLAYEDSGVVRRLRAAGAVFIGKTNTAEFGQSATSENRLGVVTRNPWRTALTPGGSSGGAAVSVAAGYVPLALGADGGGSIRIPAAMTGTFGFKPTYGLCPDEGGFRGMSDFCCPGPFANSVADARLFLSVLAECAFARSRVARGRRIGFCLTPDGRPVEKDIQSAVLDAAKRLGDLGHCVEEIRIDLEGWNDAFGPLVLAEEWRERGHFLDCCPTELTDYEYASLQAAARDLTTDKVERARRQHLAYRARIATLFENHDALLLPTTASPAFPIDTRPQEIAGRSVGRLWGAFPFTSPFNVGGNPAAALPAGLSGGLPVSVQLVGACGTDAALLDLAEELETALGFSSRYRKAAS